MACVPPARSDTTGLCAGYPVNTDPEGEAPGSR